MRSVPIPLVLVAILCDWIIGNDLEAPAACWSGWLPNEASAGQNRVAVWLERGVHQFHQECPPRRPNPLNLEEPHVRHDRDRPAQVDPHSCRG